MTVVHLPYTRSCFVCGANNPAGLQLRFRAENGAILSDYIPRSEHAGYTGIVHGGVVAAALDEVMFWAASFARRRFHLSVEMELRWVQKVRVGGRYRLEGEFDRAHRALCMTRSVLRDESGRICAEAQGKYFALRPKEVPLEAAEFCFDPATLTPQELFGVVPT